MPALLRALSILLIPVSFCPGQDGAYPNRWVFFSRNLGNDQHVADFREVARVASAHGLNGVIFSSSFDNLDRQNDAFRRRLAEVRQIAADGEARLQADPPVAAANAGFEEYSGNTPKSWRFADSPGVISFIDTQVFHGGAASLRMENFSADQYGHGRVMQEIAVMPNRCYRVTAWVKTEELQPAAAFRIQVLAPDGCTVAPWDPAVPATTGWRKRVFGFNSANYEMIRLYAGVWGGQSGRFWLDDFQVEEVDLVNVLRRDGTPLRVEGEQTGTLDEEDVDFAPVADKQLNFNFNHDGPAIKLLPGTRISDGERLRVSYYHGMSINSGQVSACMSEPETMRIVAANARLIHELLAPRKYMLSIDEIRAGGSDEACRQRGLTMGRILGDFITGAFLAIREVNPEAEVFAWSDMLDPNHNAHGNYYLVEGDYTGSWENIPAELNIVCWYYAKRKESLAFFSQLGYRTLAGAYYDGDNLDNPKGWLEALKDTPGAIGIMYTTWEDKYGLLADFGDLVSRPSEPLPQ